MNTQLSPQSGMPVIALTPYEEDSFTWASEQIDLLRGGQLDKIDAMNIAEEMELLMVDITSGMESKLVHLLSHLLKWEYQPELRRYGNASWRSTIRNNRLDISIARDSKAGVRKVYDRIFERAYKRARLEAEDETGLPLSTFPEVCPYTDEQIFNNKFFPGVPVETPPVEKKRSQKGKRKR